MDLTPYRTGQLTNARKRYQRLRSKANQALAYAFSPIGHISDLLEFERAAEAQQLCAHTVHALELEAAKP